jgi:hypothetical protein
MDLKKHLSRMIVIAEDLLTKEEIESCIAVSDEIELVMSENNSEKELFLYDIQLVEQLKALKIKLNNKMARKVRQSL